MHHPLRGVNQGKPGKTFPRASHPAARGRLIGGNFFVRNRRVCPSHSRTREKGGLSHGATPRPRHARKRGGRWLLPALVGSACAVFLLCLLPHLMPTASASGQPAASPAPVESAPDSGTPGISVNWEPSPSPAPEEQEEAPWYLRLVNLENRLPQDFTVELAQVDGGQFDARAAEALSQMLADMEAQGLSPMVCSSFRTWEDRRRCTRIKSAACWRRAIPKRRRKRGLPVGGAGRGQRAPAGPGRGHRGLQYQILEEEQENTPSSSG